MRMSKILSICNVLLVLFLMQACANESQSSVWTGTWGTAPQLVEPHNCPPEPGLTDNVLRQVFRVSISGEKVRMTFSNEYSKQPVEMKSVSIALSKGAYRTDAATSTTLTFDGKKSVTMQPGATVVSDPVEFHLPALAEVAVTISFGKTSPETVTGHPGSRTTSYIIEREPASDDDFAQAVTTDHWYALRGMDVLASGCAAVAILGNSITDGRGSETNRQNRWPDHLASKLQENEATRGVGVLNMGIGGNCVLRERGGLGPAGEIRFDADVLNQANVKWVILFEGVNDLCNSRDAVGTAQRLEEAFALMAGKAHEKGMKVYGATIMPVKQHYYYSENHEAGRQMFNAWVRQADCFDAVIDFDELMRSEEDPETMQAAFQDDYLHPNAPGHKRMGLSVPVELFE